MQRLGQLDRGAPRGARPELSTDERRWQRLIEPGLVLALAVAKSSEHPDDVPRVLRPVLGFAKWNARAFDIARRALDGDPAFRARVAEVVDADDADMHAFWLFLHRPEGWEDELTVLADAQAVKAVRDAAEREERGALQRLRSVEEAREKAEQARRDAEAAARTAEEKLVAERRARQAAKADAHAARDEVSAVRNELAAARQEVADARAAGEEAARDVARLRERVAALERDLDSAQTTAARGRSQPAATSPPGAATSGADQAALARAVTDAAEGAARLARALSAAAAAFGSGSEPEVREAPRRAARPDASRPEARGAVAPPSAAAQVAAARSQTERSVRSTPAPRRRPTALPPATFEDSPEAAEHLVRVRGALLLVDGYNAAFAGRGGANIAERRSRLVDALGELAARTGVKVHAIFDGADQPAPPGSQPAPEGVRVSFTRADVEADDVILELVDQIPVGRPVIVATSDRRVQSGARQRGANVISTEQLYGVLRRER